MRRTASITACVLLASSASAQVSTTCMAMGAGMIHCDSTDPQAEAEGWRELGLAISQIKENSLRAKLGKMVAAGDCTGASTYALQKGRFDMAQGIKQFCAANRDIVPQVATTAAVAPQPQLSPYEAGRAAARAQMGN